MKQRTHLTPDEVQEFIDLGVDFGETTNVWLMYADKSYELSVNGKMNLATEYIIPAPNLQETIESLPSIKTMTDEEIFNLNGRNHLHIFYPSLIRRMDGYLVTYENGYVDEEPLYESDFHDNPLNAVIETLRWVCKHHPETLTKTE